MYDKKCGGTPEAPNRKSKSKSNRKRKEPFELEILTTTSSLRLIYKVPNGLLNMASFCASWAVHNGSIAWLLIRADPHTYSSRRIARPARHNDASRLSNHDVAVAELILPPRTPLRALYSHSRPSGLESPSEAELPPYDCWEFHCRCPLWTFITRVDDVTRPQPPSW